MDNSLLNVFNDLYKKNRMYYGWDLCHEFTHFIKNNNLKCKTVLDIGCGEGRYSLFLAEHGCNVTAIDASDIGIEKLYKIAQKRKLNINAQVKNLEKFNFNECKYDIIIATTILDHLKDGTKQKVIKGIKKSLKINGILYVNVFTVEDPGFKIRNSENIKEQIVSETACCVQNYYQPYELKQQFSDFDILYYYEGIEPDLSHGNPHLHGWARMIAKKIIEI